jgi:hypothetical protein
MQKLKAVATAKELAFVDVNFADSSGDYWIYG